MKEFYDFGSLNKHYKDAQAEADAKKEKEKQDERKEKFDELLKDKFDKVISGSFATTLEGIDHLNIISAPVDKNTGEVEALYVMPFYSKGDKQYSETLTLHKDGVLGGKISENIKISRENIYDEVLYIIETINLDFFEKVDDEILPAEEIGGSGARGIGGSGRMERPTDARRIEFMRNQKNVLFGFASKNNGFKGYYGYVFPKFFVLENEKVGNAAFFRNFDEGIIEVDENRYHLPPERRMTEEERKQVLDKYWEPVGGLNKSEITKAGAERKVHPQMKNDEWEKIMQMEIDKRS